VNPALYFALSGAGVLVLLAIWRTRAMNRRFLAGDYFAGEDHSAPSEPDYSCLELGSKNLRFLGFRFCRAGNFAALCP